MAYSLFDNVELNEPEYLRYARHLSLPQIGTQGQKKIKNAKVICIGTGGLGSIALMYLAAAGLGNIAIVDYDNVDLSNLQRQLIHSEKFLERSKIESAIDTISKINPNCNIIPYNLKLTYENVLEVLYPYDIVIEGTDNFDTKYLINDACVLLNKPEVYGAIFQFQGQVSVFNYRGGPNYRDIYPIIPSPNQIPSCSEAGVIGVLPGVIGILQATETLKLILGIGEILNKKLLIYDALKASFSSLSINTKINIKQEYFYQLKVNSGSLERKKECGPPEITVSQLQKLIDKRPHAFLIIDVRTKQEHLINKIPDSISLPINQLENTANINWINFQSKQKQIILHCKTGQRSAQAIQILEKYGVYAYNLEGGIIAWQQNKN
uniref:Probable molybdopterin-synthase adenylyltransferase n=1 Tax=Sciadococcus taiwanensis TaxID=3028030 RepID=A0A9Y1I213_9RHOD|nr:molybdopterin biosynthesis protein [Sciadococcus taiwanensis]